MLRDNFPLEETYINISNFIFKLALESSYIFEGFFFWNFVNLCIWIEHIKDILILNNVS